MMNTIILPVLLGSDGNLIWKLFHLLIKDMTIIRKEYDRLNNVVSLPKNIVVSLILIGLGVRKIFNIRRCYVGDNLSLLADPFIKKFFSTNTAYWRLMV